MPTRLGAKLWESTKRKVVDFEDGLGRAVDKSIFDTVIALNALGFETLQSCGGHLNHGLPYPWIDLEGNEQQHKLALLLTEFYANRSTLWHAILKCDPMGQCGGFRLQSNGGELLPFAKDKLKKIKLYRKEMLDFTAFLKSKIFDRR